MDPRCRCGHGTSALVPLDDAVQGSLIKGVKAGICILEEAGGVAFGGKSGDLSGHVDAALLGECTILERSCSEACLAGRKYLIVRGIAPTSVSYTVVVTTSGS